MRLLIVGLGAVGAVYAWHLEKAGAEVHVLVKDSHVSRLRTQPIRLRQIIPGFFGGRRPTSTIDFQVAAERIHSLSNIQGIPSDFDAVLVCTSAEGLRSPAGWLKTLANQIPNATIFLFTPGPLDIQYAITALGIPESRVSGGGITIMSWTAPLPSQRFDPLADKTKPLAPTSSADNQLNTTTGSADPIIAYYVPGPQAVSVSTPIKRGTRPTRAQQAALDLASLFKAGGLGCNIISAQSHKRALSIGLAIASLLVALESCNWSLSAMAANERGILKLAAAAARESVRSTLLQRNEKWLAFFLPLFFYPWVLTLVAFIAPWFLRSVVDIEAFLKYHFSKVGGQTKLMVDQFLEEGPGSLPEAHGSPHLRALIARNPRWASNEKVESHIKTSACYRQRRLQMEGSAGDMATSPAIGSQRQSSSDLPWLINQSSLQDIWKETEALLQPFESENQPVLHHDLSQAKSRQKSNEAKARAEAMAALDGLAQKLDSCGQEIQQTLTEQRAATTTKPGENETSSSSASLGRDQTQIVAPPSTNPSREPPVSTEKSSASTQWPSLWRQAGAPSFSVATVSAPDVGAFGGAHGHADESKDGGSDRGASEHAQQQKDEKKLKKMMFRIPGFRLGRKGKDSDDHHDHATEGTSILKTHAILEKSLSFSIAEMTSRKASMWKREAKHDNDDEDSSRGLTLKRENTLETTQSRQRSTTAPSSTSRSFFGILPSSPSNASLVSVQKSKADSLNPDVNPVPPAVTEEKYLVRVFRENGSFTTIGCPISTTTEEMIDILRRKFFIQDSTKYILRLHCHLYERTLLAQEQPVEIQSTLFKQLGYNMSDNLSRLGREDYSYVCKFVFKPYTQPEELVQSYFEQMKTTPSFVNLSGLDLPKLPTTLTPKASEIEALSLARNYAITDIPQQIAKQFTSLRYLAMTWSNLTSVPSGVSLITNLIELDLTANKITSLADTGLENLTNLQILNLSHNLIETISEDAVKSFPHLKILNLSNNKLRRFPSEICKPLSQTLRFLDVSFCKIKGKLPDCVCELKYLTVLKVAFNFFSGGLPWGMGDLHRLKEIDIRGNSFGETASGDEAAVLGVISRCPALEHVKADGNKIRWVGRWRDRAGCRQPGDAKAQDASSSAIAANEKEGDLDAGDDVDGEGPVGPCRSVEFQKLKLDVQGNQLSHLPQEIWKCGKLRTINASSNLLDSFPEPPVELITPMTPSSKTTSLVFEPPNVTQRGSMSSNVERGSTMRALKRITSSILFEDPKEANSISYIPGEIERMRTLQMLYINGNKLSTIPGEVGKLVKLTILDLGSQFGGKGEGSGLRYNTANWPYDWNWNWNLELKYLNLSGNRRLEIKPSHQYLPISHFGLQGTAGSDQFGDVRRDLSDFSGMVNMKMLGLMDVTCLIAPPDESGDKRVRTTGSDIFLAGLPTKFIRYTVADTLAKLKPDFDYNPSEATLTSPTILSSEKDSSLLTSASIKESMAVKDKAEEAMSIWDLVLPTYRNHENEALFGMIDGHGTLGGSKVAQHLYENFATYFAQELAREEKEMLAKLETMVGDTMDKMLGSSTTTLDSVHRKTTSKSTNSAGSDADQSQGDATEMLLEPAAIENALRRAFLFANRVIGTLYPTFVPFSPPSKEGAAVEQAKRGSLNPMLGINRKSSDGQVTPEPTTPMPNSPVSQVNSGTVPLFGCSAVFVYMVGSRNSGKSGKCTMYVANVGDGMAVLSKAGGKAQVLSENHDLGLELITATARDSLHANTTSQSSSISNSEISSVPSESRRSSDDSSSAESQQDPSLWPWSEIDRIQKAGGWISSKGLVNGILNSSRGFGYIPCLGPITSEPHIQRVDLELSPPSHPKINKGRISPRDATVDESTTPTTFDDEFIVLASSSIWKSLRMGGTYAEGAQNIVNIARSAYGGSGLSTSTSPTAANGGSMSPHSYSTAGNRLLILPNIDASATTPRQVQPAGGWCTAATKVRDIAVGLYQPQKDASSGMSVMMLGLRELALKTSWWQATNTARRPSLDVAQKADDKTKRQPPKPIPEETSLQLTKEPAEIEPPTGKIALVFTDIKNSTAIWETKPIAMRQAIKLHNTTMRRLLKDSGGYEVKTEGDAFMVSFQDVLSAVEWCLTAQLELRNVEWPQEILETADCGDVWYSNGEYTSQPTSLALGTTGEDDGEHSALLFRGLWIRMGIHFGSPLCEIDPTTGRMDYYGPMVNRSARVSQISQGGQILVSSDAMKEIQSRIGYHSAAALHRSKTISSSSTQSNNQAKAISTLAKDGHDMMQLARTESEDPVVQKLNNMGLYAWLVGETKLKGLETPEIIYMIYPRELSQRQRYLSLLSSGAIKSTISNSTTSTLKRQSSTDNRQSVPKLDVSTSSSSTAAATASGPAQAVAGILHSIAKLKSVATHSERASTTVQPEVTAKCIQIDKETLRGLQSLAERLEQLATDQQQASSPTTVSSPPPPVHLPSLQKSNSNIVVTTPSPTMTTPIQTSYITWVRTPSNNRQSTQSVSSLHNISFTPPSPLSASQNNIHTISSHSLQQLPSLHPAFSQPSLGEYTPTSKHTSLSVTERNSTTGAAPPTAVNKEGSSNVTASGLNLLDHLVNARKSFLPNTSRWLKGSKHTSVASAGLVPTKKLEDVEDGDVEGLKTIFDTLVGRVEAAVEVLQGCSGKECEDDGGEGLHMLNM
ncbi:cysteinyl-tRNA synthetase [Chytridiales sp. JEL 0842]|nr:cysteinyl-tRNA synthetase [Chytridiales sp. JEL 0842]